MRCFSLEAVYLYLEEEFSPAGREAFEKHLSSCPKCREAVEERRLLLQTAATLPTPEVPPGFTRQVMEKIFPPGISLFKWLGVLAAGISSAVMGILVFTRVTDQSLPGLLIQFQHSLWNSVKSLAVFLVKGAKLAFLFLEILGQLAGIMISGIIRLTGLITLEIQVGLAALTAVFILTAVFGLRRFLLSGVKS